MMTRKDYVAIAQTFRDEIDSVDRNVLGTEQRELVTWHLKQAARSMAGALRGTNPNFDYHRFVAAATGE